MRRRPAEAGLLRIERRGRDLNPRRTLQHVRDFQSRSLDHSDTSPSDAQRTAPPRPPRYHPPRRRGGRAVECGGLENRYPSLGGSRVQIPPPPLDRRLLLGFSKPSKEAPRPEFR